MSNTTKRAPAPHPRTALLSTSRGFHPLHLDYPRTQITLAAFDRAATHREELDYVQNLFGIHTHPMRAGW